MFVDDPAPPSNPPLALPPVASWSATAAAVGRQRLPPLPTTALHGALGHALGPQLGRALMSPEGAAAPLVLGGPPSNGAPLELRPNDPLTFRITLLGADNARLIAPLAQGLARAFQGGLGIDPRDPSGPRPALSLLDFAAVPPAPKVFGRAALLTLVSPAQLLVDHVLQPLTTEHLWRAIRRRVRMLAELTQTPVPFLSEVAPFQLVDPQFTVQRVERYSSRQKKRMFWEGWVGAARLEGDLAPHSLLFHWLEQVHIGKGSGFGLGALRFIPLPG